MNYSLSNKELMSKSYSKLEEKVEKAFSKIEEMKVSFEKRKE